MYLRVELEWAAAPPPVRIAYVKDNIFFLHYLLGGWSGMLVEEAAVVVGVFLWQK